MTVTWLSSHDRSAATNAPGFQVAQAAGPLSAHRLRLVGELDLASALLLTAAGLVLAAEGELISGLAVRIDLSELSFLDSSGLTALNDRRAADPGRSHRHHPDPCHRAGPAAAHPRLGRRPHRPGIDCAQLTAPPVLPACLPAQTAVTKAQIFTNPDRHRCGA